MPAFVALLRGINVGKAKRVPMAEFRGLLGRLDYAGVTTVLNSGNALFRAPGGTPASHADAISRALFEQFALEVPVVVKSAGEFAAIVSGNALAVKAGDPSRLLVAFFSGRAARPDLDAVARLVRPPEEFLLGSHAAYLLCASAILQSRAGVALLGHLGGAVTTRNWATVLKLNALLTDSGA